MNIKYYQKLQLRRRFSSIRLKKAIKPDRNTAIGQQKDITNSNLPSIRTLDEVNNRAEAVSRTLTANMTGHILLNDNGIDLHYKKGSLYKISRSGDILINGMDSRTRFVTSRGTISYRNESAFSFDDYPDYGLRTLQVPQKTKKHDFRVITDFVFEEKRNEALITVTVDYPIFEKGTIVKEAAVFETPLFSLDESKIEIKADGNRAKTIIINPDDTKNLLIPGKTFEIKSEDRIFQLTLIEKLENHRLSSIEGLSIGTGYYRGNKVLFINPGGSYSSAPAEYYSGIREQFSFTIGVRKAGTD